MALVLGTNCGFVTTAPTSDPEGTSGLLSTRAWGIEDTSPADAVKIIEIGWWANEATSEANFEVGIYSWDGGSDPNLLIHVTRTNAKGTGSGWISAAVDFNISSSTTYWIAVQLDSTTGTTSTDQAGSGGSGYAYIKDRTTFPDDWGSSWGRDSDGMATIYAITESAAGFTRKIKISGTFQDKPIKTKVAGTFEDKPIKIKVGGTFQDA